jgi:hypothetical protein
MRGDKRFILERGNVVYNGDIRRWWKSVHRLLFMVDRVGGSAHADITGHKADNMSSNDRNEGEIDRMRCIVGK